ncbi:MAG: hypothetical protein IJP44_02240 [Bacteroidales bacterium]|nr:hypothetical protein [Bacteroidales bacterium]
MREAKVDIIDQTESVSLYTITFEGNELSEFEKFMDKFKDNATLQRDYQLILLALDKITTHGALERNFRPEGKMNDNVVALPIDKSRLRLYCLRLSDKILILGNGGEKNTKTYEESDELKGYVMDLQKFDALLKSFIQKGEIEIEKTKLVGIEDKTFRL